MLKALRILAPALLAVGAISGTMLMSAGPSSASTTTGGAVTVTAPATYTCLYGTCTPHTFCSDTVCVPGPPPACAGGYCIPQTPICDYGYCIPQTWYVATSVVTNGGLYRIGTTFSDINTTTVTQSASESYEVSGSLTASINGTFGVGGEQVNGAVIQIEPGLKGQVTGSKTIDGSISVPPHSIGTLYFGIRYTKTSGTVYSVNTTGHITTVATGVVATDPRGWGYLQTIQPYVP